MTFYQLQEKINSSKPLSFGDILSRSIDLFKKVWVQGFVTLLLTGLLAIPFFIAFYIPAVILGLSAESLNGDIMKTVGVLMALIMIVLLFVMFFGIITIATALRLAFYRIIKIKDLEEMGSEDYFYFLKKQHRKKTLLFALAQMGISLLAAALCYFPIFYAIVPLSLMMPIYAFNPNLSVQEIVKLGFNLGNKNWLIVFGLMFVAGFLALLVGLILCGIGIYFTASFGLLIQYFVYKDTFGFSPDDDNIPQIEA